MDLIKVECDLVRAFSWELPAKPSLAFAQYDNAIFLDGDWFDHQAGLSVTFFFGFCVVCGWYSLYLSSRVAYCSVTL